METKNILIGKIGKSIRMSNVHIEKGGGPEAVLYSTMARINPEFNFYIGGPNDLNKLSKEKYDYMFPNHNVFSIYRKSADSPHDYECMLDDIDKQNIKFDFALIFNGICGTRNIGNLVTYPNSNKYYKTLVSFRNYAAPYIFLLNKLQIPFYVIAEDARYISVKAFDLYNRERLVFTQCNATATTYRHFKSDTDFSFVGPETVECVYAGIEKAFLAGIKPNWKELINIDTKLKSKPNEHLIVLSNGCGTKGFNMTGNNISRLPTYKEWIFEGLKGTPYEGTPVYGSWDKTAYDEYPNQIINKLILDLKLEIARAKYGFVYSMVPGFVTAKPYELIVLGLIPLMHSDYDKDHLLNIPDFCYCKDVNDFIHKMELLDSDDNLYKKVLNQCFDCILPEYTDGSYLNNFIFGRIAKDLNFDYKPRKGVKSIFDRFSKDMLNHDLTDIEN